MNQDILTIAQHFSHHNIISAEPFGNGNINDTYLVTDSNQQFILQRLNQAVFNEPQLIFENYVLLQELLIKQATNNKPVHIPKLILTGEGKSHHRDKQNMWRAQEFIENSHETDKLLPHQAQSIGQLLGGFHKLGQGQPITRFHDTLPRLHATSHHIQQYNSIKQTITDAPQDHLFFCEDCINKLQQKALDIDQQLRLPTIPKRLIHGDPKLANILFDKTTNKACSLIDLDTIGPGLIHHDLSDLIRSSCNHGGEEGRPDETHFELALAQEIITGYSSETASFLSSAEINLLGKSLWLIPFELGIRFLNDYLSGSTYFKTSSPHQNCLRARNQFELAFQIVHHKAELQDHIHACFT